MNHDVQGSVMHLAIPKCMTCNWIVFLRDLLLVTDSAKTDQFSYSLKNPTGLQHLEGVAVNWSDDHLISRVATAEFFL